MRYEVQTSYGTTAKQMVLAAAADANRHWRKPSGVGSRHRRTGLRLFPGAKHEVRALSDYIAAQGDQPAPYWFAVLDAHAGTGHVFEAIYIADQTDAVYTVGLPERRRGRRNDLLGLDLYRRPFVSEARTATHKLWSKTFLSTVSGRLAVALVIPSGRQVVVGERAIDQLPEFISHLPAESGLLTMLLDRHGQAIADSRRILIGQPLN